MLQPISIDTSSFPEIRRKGCVYVDKTAYFHRLATGPNSCFFLARPRRFGKSLMLSTLKAIFEGRRELFEGLALEKTDWAWERYPVLHFDFSFSSTSTSAEAFERSFPNTVSGVLAESGFKYDPRKSPSDNFGNAIDGLSRANGGQGVVILIDEYDDPVARLLHKPDEAGKVRDSLASFYGQMKGRTEKIRFLMITGVSKFTKMSVFSALSNLIDLSLKDECATMLGYTEEELDRFFDGHLRAHAEMMKLSYADYRAELKRWFNGYRFGRQCPTTVYNPVSVGNNLAYPEIFFQPGWADTGKASMLMNFLKRGEYLSCDLDGEIKVREASFDVTDLRNLKTIPMLYQAGYLTLADFDPRTRFYALRVPNEEVREDLATLTTAVIANQDAYWVATLGEKLLSGEWRAFFVGLKALYAGMPYGPSEASVQEYSFERVLLTLLRSQGI
ncbi:MAG: AAA family ATPase, partial [Victivallales bacterium]|nr:AAA family ATPase [Victivallales bacterium]